jgi:hypothetical protein
MIGDRRSFFKDDEIPYFETQPSHMDSPMPPRVAKIDQSA